MSWKSALRTGPKFIYVLPNFQNPTGVTMPLERRLKLIELADHYGVPIVEDDPYGQLRFEGEHIPNLEVLDSQKNHDGCCYTGNVIYLSTFSKTLAPGIRLAWVIAPPEVIRKMVRPSKAPTCTPPPSTRLSPTKLAAAVSSIATLKPSARSTASAVT